MYFLDKFPQKVTITVIFIILISLSSCAKTAIEGGGESPVVGAVNPFPSFRDVPGITPEEIAAIEALQREYASFSYAGLPNTEAFIKENGEVGGFTTLFCSYLSDFFAIPFIPQIQPFNTMLANFNNRTLDFNGSLAVTPARLDMYSMTNPIADRQLKLMRIWGSPSMEQIIKERLPRYALSIGSNNRNLVAAALQPDSYIIVDTQNIDDAYQALKDGRADAYVEVNTTVDAYPQPDVYSELFFPLVFSNVSFTTSNPTLAPIISVMEKALQNGARAYINYLNNLGLEEYKIERFRSQLTREERSFLQNPSPVLLAAQYFNYPVSFYNNFDNEWQGIAFDILAEVEKFTGLKFTVTNKTDTELLPLLDMLSAGTAHILPDLAYSAAMEDRFIWSQNNFLSNQYALLSKTETPNIILSDITNARVGLIKDTSPAEMFRLYFPDAPNTVEYETDASAFSALDRGEVNLIMASKNRLLSALNYYELPNYKVNFLFSHSETSFAFNRNQETLHSIIDKIIPLLDTGMITEQWMTKTYDYRTKVAEGRIPWLVGAITLAFMAILVLILFIRGRGEGRRLAVLVAEKTKEATEASDAKSRFISTMTHELRTPMNSIIGFSELALGDTDPVKSKDYLNKILLNSDLLLQIINDVLDISKIEAGKMELEHIPFDLHELLTACKTIITPRASEKGVNLYFYAEPSIDRKLIGDPLRLRQVILNLLSNAVKFTGKDGVIKISATLGCQAPDREKVPGTGSVTIHFEVKDSGIGMSPEHLAKISQPFMQADTSTTRKYGGTGLGLAICNNIIEMMGSRLDIESMIGVGSKFSFEITFDTLAIAEESAKVKEFSENASGSQFTGEILLCEDNQMNQQVFCENIKRVGLKVDVAENGREGFNMVRRRHEKGEKPYDIIFMDIHMPIMDGLEASALISELKTGTPIVALTANVMSHDKELYEKSGMTDSVSKPFRTQELLGCLKKYLSV